jgi:hypothetical protein
MRAEPKVDVPNVALSSSYYKEASSWRTDMTAAAPIGLSLTNAAEGKRLPR